MKDITQQIKAINKKLSKLAKKQIPFATSQALNDSAYQANKALKIQAAKKLDRPTKFTINAFQVKRSTKRNLVSTVFVEAKREYLEWVIHGGAKTGRLALPSSVRLNKFGNIPNRRKGIIKKPNQFIATINGTYGIWEKKRGGKGLKLLAAFEQGGRWNSQLNMQKIVEGIFRARFVGNYKRRLLVAVNDSLVRKNFK